MWYKKIKGEYTEIPINESYKFNGSYLYQSEVRTSIFNYYNGRLDGNQSHQVTTENGYSIQVNASYCFGKIHGEYKETISCSNTITVLRKKYKYNVPDGPCSIYVSDKLVFLVEYNMGKIVFPITARHKSDKKYIQFDTLDSYIHNTNVYVYAFIDLYNGYHNKYTDRYILFKNGIRIADLYMNGDYIRTINSFYISEKIDPNKKYLYKKDIYLKQLDLPPITFKYKEVFLDISFVFFS
jgi:hypothetical protein